MPTMRIGNYELFFNRGGKMAITSSMFGQTILTGKDAEQMLKQMSNSKPNDNAKRSLQNARDLRKKTATRA